MPLFSGISNSYLNWIECFNAVWNNNSQWLSPFFPPGNMWDTQSNVRCLQLSLLGPFSPSLSVREFSNQPSLRTCASTLMPDLCEKEAPVSCKFNLNVFGNSETRTCLLSYKKKSSKCIRMPKQKLLPVHMQVYIFSIFLILKEKEGKFLTVGHCRGLHHTSLLQRRKGLVKELYENFISLEWNT